MSNTLILNTPQVATDLPTFTFTVPTTGLYNIDCMSTQTPTASPQVPGGNSSTLSIVINQNGSPIFTAPALGQTQSALQFKFAFPFVAADIVTIVLSSSAAVDNKFNSLKTTVSIASGGF